MNAKKPLPEWSFFVFVAAVAIAFWVFVTWNAPQAPKKPELSKDELIRTACSDIRAAIRDLQHQSEPDGASIERGYRMLRDLEC